MTAPHDGKDDTSAKAQDIVSVAEIDDQSGLETKSTPQSSVQAAISSTNHTLSGSSASNTESEAAQGRSSQDLDRLSRPTSLPRTPPSEENTVTTATTAKQYAPLHPPRIASLSQNRNRGYSLRRSLFASNIQKQNEDHSSVIELESSPSNPRKTPLEKGEKGPTVITVQDAGSSGSFPSKGTYYRSNPGGRNPTRLPEWTKQKRSNLSALQALMSSFQTIFDRTFGPTELPHTADGRHIAVNVSQQSGPIDERTGKPYVSNRIRSCKYTLWNFFPKQLVAQFGKLANFYFLIISILQMIPGLSTTGTYTTIVPLLIFVGISMAKEGYEDIRRNRLDKEENERVTLVLNKAALNTEANANSPASIESSSTAWTETKWQDVKVGDAILLARDAPVPCDVVLLYSSGSESTVHIETKSLDGETNLKTKKPLDKISQHCQEEAAIARLEADFVVEDPNLDLYRFEGKVSIAGQTLPLTVSEVIYRGSIVRNTPIAVGLAIYTGEESRIRQNANKNPRVKAPTLQAKVNRVVIVVAFLVFFIAAILSIGYTIWKRTTENRSWYLDDADVPLGHILTSFIIMMNTMLPLSLYVSLEIVKVVQIFMMNDIDMYDPISDTPIEPKTSTLNEELGQVSYIFSDKTGTLTNNSMKFRKMSVAGTAWLHDRDLRHDDGVESTKLKHKKRSVGKQKHAKQKHQRGESKAPLMHDTSSRSGDVEGLSSPDRDLPSTGNTGDLLEYIHRRPQSLFARKVRFFLLALSLCHTCMPEKGDDGEVSFQAASPDELALVTAARDLGYIVTDRQNNTITVKTYSDIDGEDAVFETYQILEVIEFSSARKRMSIVIRLPDGRCCIFTKGADTVVRQLLARADIAEMYVEDIRRKSEARKSMEAHAVIQRRSTQLSRNSLSSPAQHTTIGRQSSVSLGRRHSARESIDLWLKEREAGTSTPRQSGIYYTPRHSESAAARAPTIARSNTGSPRSSFQTDNRDYLIDDSIVINDHATFQLCFNHINEFATEGLRTLVYVHRFIPEDEYREWKQLYHAASTSLVDRQQQIEKAAESIERQFELTGATAIEDKLQIGVPDAIERFRRAGIKMWMLTGDKRETAINIGYSCRLIKDYSTVMILDHENGNLSGRIAKFVSDVNRGQNAHSVLVVDGQTLTAIDTDFTMKTSFTELAIAIDSVICCRASPSQKADLVKTIRTKVRGSVTLAVGDGANDIAMIQEAHLGIGIAGKEGLQAARSSDYSIGQFRFLLKLLLVHGRWNYVRVCKYTLGTFWKEMLFYLVQACYQRWNGYTGTSLYEPWSLSMFNTLFTSLPIIFMGAFEKDLTPATLLAVPELYSLGQQNRGFNIPLYAYWAFLGALEAMMVYFTMYGIYGEALFTRDNQLFAMGALAFTACVTIISLKLQVFELHNKSIMAAIAMFLSVGGWWLWNLILSQTYDPDNRLYNVNGGLVHSFGRNILWWLTLILIVLEVSVFEILIKTVKTIYFPNDVETFQVYERDVEIKKRFEESAANLLQQGWNRGTKKSSLELARDEEEQAKREAEIQDILDRPRTMNDATHDRTDTAPAVGIRKRQSWQPIDTLEMIPTNEEVSPPFPTARRSIDVGELLSKGFGNVRRDSMK